MPINPQRSPREFFIVLIACFFVLAGMGITLFLSAKFIAIPLFGQQALNLGRMFGLDDALGFLIWLLGSMLAGGAMGMIFFAVFLKFLNKPQQKGSSNEKNTGR